MQRLWPRTREAQIQYHLDDGRAPDFTVTQPHRIELAKFLLDKIVRLEGERRLTIWELGCGAGDISGPYSIHHDVTGVDIVPMAQTVCHRRWPDMNFMLCPVEQLIPAKADVLILCEVLEHLDDPVKLVESWLPKAQYVLIGHPLFEPNPPYEPGHIWSYEEQDFENWFSIGGHQRGEKFIFEMEIYERMVMGSGKNIR